ncbi:MAG: DUF504 domain-containing protein [Hadesarchaea archaeon]|nr:DUF504 domain-containing protein [Hadesarchaea archaeon]
MTEEDPRDFLNKLKWHPDYALKNAEITIVHRGAPGDKRVIKGENIKELESGFMLIKSKPEKVRIPYHRIRKITIPEGKIWDRNQI